MMNENRQRAAYILSDLAASAVAVLLFNIYRHHAMAPGISLGAYLGLPMVVMGQIVFPLLLLLVYYLSGYYNSVFQKSRLQDLIITFGSCIAGTLLIVFSVLIDDLSMDRRQDYALFGVLFVMLFSCLWIPRILITGLTAHRLRRGELSRGIVIVGYGRQPGKFAEQIKRLRPSMGLRTMALVSLDDRHGYTIDGLTVEPRESLAEVCSRPEVERAILLPHPSKEWKPTMRTLRQLMKMRMTVLMPRDRMIWPMSRPRHLDVGAEPLVNMTRAYIPPSTENFKRLSDIVVSSIAIVILALPVACLSIAVRLSTGASPIYVQRRLGRGGRPFNIYKLRTMCVDAEPDGKPLLAVNGDRRITPIGAFLRKYRLDELPQFWNVLRGDMSLVGPRPEREFFVDAIVSRDPSYVILHQVRPGITSWGMVKYGYASNVDQMLERMRYDLLYVENISFLLDAKIIFYTFHTVITGKGL